MQGAWGSGCSRRAGCRARPGGTVGAVERRRQPAPCLHPALLGMPFDLGCNPIPSPPSRHPPPRLPSPRSFSDLELTASGSATSWLGCDLLMDVEEEYRRGLLAPGLGAGTAYAMDAPTGGTQ